MRRGHHHSLKTLPVCRATRPGRGGELQLKTYALLAGRPFAPAVPPNVLPPRTSSFGIRTVKAFTALVICGAIFCDWVSHATAGAFELQDGDRVVLLGSTLVEHEQSSGYWETMLTARFPDRNIVFRNLGWSGDTVYADAWAGFGTTAEGFRELKEHVEALQPTVIFLCYGANESFAGAGGLPGFEAGLATLLDTLAATKARIVLVTPTPQEDLGPPLPDPAAHNQDLSLYRDAIARTAKNRGLRILDLHAMLNASSPAATARTDNRSRPTEPSVKGSTRCFPAPRFAWRRARPAFSKA
jgi:lysophospholipase L1-like esterase